jgi:3-oxoacyl-[acyl-carrier protein] reductase
MADLKDKCALVTGSARGIGLAIAVELARCGANVALCDIDGERAEKAAETVEAQGVRTLAGGVNVADAGEFDAFVDTVVERWGRLDILVNNAGITRDSLVLRLKHEEWQRVLDVNLTGTFNGCRAAAKYMARQRSGRIVNIASVVGLIGNAGQANYAASKAGVIAVTKTVAKELGSRGVTANAVAPGFIETEMTSRLPEKARQLWVEWTALKRAGKPQDVADAVVFLASDQAAYITGQVICIDGGMVM